MRGIEQLDFTKLLKNSRECCVSVTMPEFKSSFELNISEFLQEKEMTKIFSFEADFSPLSDLPLRVDALRHKARIEVDREGTRAAAVTYGVVVCSAQVFDELKIVTLDRTFIYAVVHNDTALPVLTGIMNYAE